MMEFNSLSLTEINSLPVDKPLDFEIHASENGHSRLLLAHGEKLDKKNKQKLLEREGRIYIVKKQTNGVGQYTVIEKFSHLHHKVNSEGFSQNDLDGLIKEFTLSRDSTEKTIATINNLHHEVIDSELGNACIESIGEMNKSLEKVVNRVLLTDSDTLFELYNPDVSFQKKKNLSRKLKKARILEKDELAQSFMNAVNDLVTTGDTYMDYLVSETLYNLYQGDFTAVHNRNTALIAYSLAISMNKYNINNQVKIDNRIEIINPRTALKAALLHDLGKLSPELKPLVYKQGKLSDEEMTQMRRHPQFGVEILHLLPGFRSLLDKEHNPVKDVINYHHEKPLGGGYPTGRRLGEFHSVCKVVAVADIYEGITGYRPYRENVKRTPIEVGEMVVEELFGEHRHVFEDVYKKTDGRYERCIGEYKAHQRLPAMAETITLLNMLGLRGEEEQNKFRTAYVDDNGRERYAA